MTRSNETQNGRIDRRTFGFAIGTGAGGWMLHSSLALAEPVEEKVKPVEKKPALIRGAFTYPPTSSLDEAGYYSWPGSSFDAEGRQEKYLHEFRQIEKNLGVRIEMEAAPLDGAESVSRFIASVKSNPPDGLLLIPFKKSHFDNVVRIIEETKIPSIVFASLGVILNVHIQRYHNQSGVHLINSLDNLDAVAQGLNAICAAAWMKQSRLVNITGEKRSESEVPGLGTRVLNVPLQRFYDLFAQTPRSEKIETLGQWYLKTALRREEPSEEDVFEAAKTYYVLKQIIEEERADAVMMTCLPGLYRPHKHVPPCMGFMSLRDQGIPAGCESDLDATLSMMLIQQLFGLPAFQHNPSMDTVKNRYVGAHCTCASRMQGPGGPAEPFILRNHAEAGWGCVPRVLFPAGQEATFIKYLSAQNPPQMLLYGGTVTGCPENPPAGGCRTNVELQLDDLEDACEVKGHHLCLFYGRHKKDIEIFCQLYGIQTVS